MRIFAVVIALGLFLTPVTASASEPEDYIEDFEDALPDDMKGTLGDSEAILDGASFKTVLTEIYAVLRRNGRDLISFLLTLLSLAALISLVEISDSRLRSAAVTASSVISAICIFERLSPIVSAVTSSLAEAGGFFSRLIPVFSAITVASGGVSTATVGATGMSLTLGIIGAFSSSILPYAISMMLLLGMLPDGQGITGGVLRAIKGFFGWGVGVICFLLGATMSLQTVIATASDSMLIRSARFTLSSAIPIVGGAVSGALSTLVSGLSYAKGVVGGGSVVVMLGIMLSPIVLLLAYRLILSLSVNFLTFLGTGGGMRAFSAMLGALDSLIGVLVMSTIVYIFEIILFIKGGVAIL